MGESQEECIFPQCPSIAWDNHLLEWFWFPSTLPLQRQLGIKQKNKAMAGFIKLIKNKIKGLSRAISFSFQGTKKKLKQQQKQHQQNPTNHQPLYFHMKKTLYVCQLLDCREQQDRSIMNKSGTVIFFLPKTCIRRMGERHNYCQDTIYPTSTTISIFKDLKQEWLPAF